MARRKELRYLTVGLQDGFTGTGAINDTPAATDTTLDVDTLVLHDSVTIVPDGARFTTAGITTVRTCSATNNSQVWTLDMTAPSAGTFDITLNGETASALAFDITGAALQTALEGLASVSVGDVTVVELTDVHTITMAGTLKNIATNTLTVDGSSLTAANSEVFTVVQTGLVTWQLTFTPAIATGSVPLDDDAIAFLPQRVTMKVGSGNIEWTESDDPQVDTDRGILDGVRLGVEQPMQVSASFVFNWLRASSGQPITVYEALHQIGGASDWHNAADDPCEPYCVDIYVIDTPPCGSEQSEVIIFEKFYKNEVNPTVEGGLVNLSGICNATAPTITRETSPAL